MYINHITLTTGHLGRSPRAAVADDALAVLVPWLQDAIASPDGLPIPVPPLAHYSCKAMVESGALVATIFAPAGPHTSGQPYAGDMLPLITFGVAQRSRQGGGLWALMVAQFGAAEGLQEPATPWCAVAIHPSIAGYPEAAKWLGDLERCIAWAWITRNAQLEAL